MSCSPAVPPACHRRIRVLAAKLVAAGALAFTLAVVLQLLLGVVLPPAGLWRGTTDGIDSSWMRSVSGVGLRSAAVSLVGALLGCSIVAISRNTAAALGIAFGYFAIAENAIRGLRPHWTPWLLGDNLAVVITNQPQNFPAVDRSTLGRDPGCLLHADVAGRGRGHLPPTRHQLIAHSGSGGTCRSAQGTCPRSARTCPNGRSNPPMVRARYNSSTLAQARQAAGGQANKAA
jgi:hypothetical protein